MRLLKRALLALAIGLSACGNNGGVQKGEGEIVGDPRFGEICTAISEDDAIFGRGVALESLQPLESIVSDCRWTSEDGAILAEVAFYTADSLRADADNPSPAALVTNMSAAWAKLINGAPQPLAGQGDEAVLFADMPGYQTQIAMRKGDVAVLVLANSGAENLSSAELAERLSAAIIAKIE